MPTTVWLKSVATKYGAEIFKYIETMSKETKTENTQGNGDLAVVSSRLSELDNLKEWLDNLKTSEHYCGYELDFGIERDEMYDYIEERKKAILNGY